jgi:hypothetical protein
MPADEMKRVLPTRGSSAVWLVMGWALVMVGCSPAAVSVDVLNKGLSHIQWPADKEGHVRLDPDVGLRLNFATVRRSQPTTPVISSYTWVRPKPEAGYDAEDYFFFSYLAATAPSTTPDVTDRAIKIADCVAKELAQAQPGSDPLRLDVRESLGKALLDKVFEKEVWLVTTRNAAWFSVDKTPQRLREWLSAPRATGDLLNGFKLNALARSYVQLTVPAWPASCGDQSGNKAFTATVLDWEPTAFFIDRSPNFDAFSLKGHHWYQDEDAGAARRLRVQIEPVHAIRIEGEAERRLVPLWWTVGMLERDAGIRVAGLRRTSGGSSLLWFEWLKPRLATAVVGRKEDVLLAPGDVVILSKSKRGRP